MIEVRHPSAADETARLLFARLQIVQPNAHSLLLAWTTDADRAARVSIAALLADAYRGAGRETALIELGDELLTVDDMRAALARSPFTIVQGAGLADSPATIVAARAVDAVVILVRRGRTKRSTLAALRSELVAAGVSIAGAVLLD